MASANDENKWKDPAVFSPSRFLKNNFQVEKEKLLTFGRGAFMFLVLIFFSLRFNQYSISYLIQNWFKTEVD